MKFSLRFNKYWLGYFLVKVFYFFFAIFFYQKLINPNRTIGDTALYLGLWSGDNAGNFDLILKDSTIMLEFIGNVCSTLLGPVYGNLPFMLIAFYGVYYSVSRLQLNKNQLLWIHKYYEDNFNFFTLNLLVNFDICSRNVKRCQN